jgi:uncharacterized protein YgiM (DUF1202 family)
MVSLLLVVSSLVIPQRASADTDLEIGGEAVISDAQGDPVRLREAAGFDQDVITLLSEGTVLDVLGGPTEADDGSFWYRVTDGDDTGYMVSDYLSRADSNSGGGDTTTTTSDVNLRDGPSTADEVITVLLPGATVTITGDPKNGFYPVTYQGTDGWAYGGYLEIGDDDSPTVGEAEVDSALNLRAGPSTADDVLEVMPGGAMVEILGDPENDYYPVRYNGTSGWAFGDYLIFEGDDDDEDPVVGEARVDSALNLREEPNTTSDVLTVMPGNAIVETLGDPENGFYPVRYNGEEGWAFGDFLDFGGAASVDSAIIWPVSGGEWQISQGYHGSSHNNWSSTYQYANSFDIVSTDGNTAGQSVYSPVNGTIRWTEAGSGGISIDMGNGYAAAIFHITVDPSLSWGDSLTQGQYIGFISGPGQDGNMGFDHLHFTVWATDDGGNWSRVSVPFTGQNAINGVDYPDSGASMEWTGTVFNP